MKMEKMKCNECDLIKDEKYFYKGEKKRKFKKCLECFNILDL